MSRRWFAVLPLVALAALARAQDPVAEPAADAVVTAADFGCLQAWPSVGHTRFTNVLGDVDATLAAARDGGPYPVGTVVQLMPTEAMVKRAPGFSPETDDWEYLKLGVNRRGEVEITDRGGAEVRNIAGKCHACHTTEPAFDHVCQEDHGCKPLPGFIVKAALKAVEKDPRCASVP